MNDLIADINCPSCRRRVKVKVKDMIPGHSKRLSCGCTIQFAGDDGRQAQRALDDLAREFRKLNRKITIKL